MNLEQRKSMTADEAIRAILTGGLVQCNKVDFYGGVRTALQKFAAKMEAEYVRGKRRDTKTKRLADVAYKVVARLDSRYMPHEPAVRAPLPERGVGPKFTLAVGVKAPSKVPSVAGVSDRPAGAVGDNRR